MTSPLEAEEKSPAIGPYLATAQVRGVSLFLLHFVRVEGGVK